MSFDKIVEKKIQEAMAEGEFDNLKGSGAPVNLDAYFATPPELRAGFSVLRNAGVIPEEMHLLKRVASLKEELAACEDEDERQRLKKALAERLLEYDLRMEHFRRRRLPGG